MPAAAIPFIIGGIGAAGSVASGLLGSSAAKSAAADQSASANYAANLQKQAADESLAFQKQQYGNSLSLLSPFYNTGTSALNRLSFLMGLSPNQGLPPGVNNPNTPTNTNNGVNLSSLLGGRGTDALNPAGSGGNFITARAYGGQVPAAGVQPGAINPGDFGPPQFTADPNDPTGQAPFPGNPDAHNFGNGITASTNQGGGAMVPRLDGGGLPGQPSPGGDFGSLAQGFNEQFQAPTDVTEQNDPGYKFRLQQGMDALQRSAAARGGLLSGGTAKDINDYAQNSASNEYSNVYNRSFNDFTTRYNIFKQNQGDLFNRLQALAGGGQTTAGQLSNAGLQTAGNVGNILLGSSANIGQQLNNAAAARGSGYVGSANALGGAIQGGTQGLSTALILKMLQGQ